MITQPGAAMLDSKLFVSRLSDPFPDLYERWWNGIEWVWVNHGRPGGVKMKGIPGAAMLNEKLFVVTDDGALWERHWRADLGRWAWEDHGRPSGTSVTTTPGAAMMDEKLFVGTSDGHLYERHWREDLGRWAWEDHGSPPDTRVATAPGAAIMNSKLFVGAENSHLFERVWTSGAWTWVDHGTAFHDQSAHVIGAPGDDPKLTIAVMGDGYAEGDMNDYRALVKDKVVSAFQLDQLGDNIDVVRVIRIDVASPLSGVTERTYDEKGTPADASDDELTSETFRFSRLGFVSTGIWSHCWIETSDRTNERIVSIRKQFAPEATNVIVLVNSSKRGGCNRGDTAAFTKGESNKVIAHELGHNLFDLGDEYNNDNQNFTGAAMEANLTEEPSSWDNLKWGDLVTDGTPLPTSASSPPSGWNNNTSVGAFEGGGARFSTGIFRPVLECRMNQNNPPWCPVCGREITRITGEFR
jgi:hypothetical protein